MVESEKARKIHWIKCVLVRSMEVWVLGGLENLI